MGKMGTDGWKTGQRGSKCESSKTERHIGQSEIAIKVFRGWERIGEF